MPLDKKREMSLNNQWLGGTGVFDISDVPEKAEDCRKACGPKGIADGVRAMPAGDVWQCICHPRPFTKAELERQRKQMDEFRACSDKFPDVTPESIAARAACQKKAMP
jgi:hypothetical protein